MAPKVRLTIKKRSEIIRRKGNGLKVSDLAREYKVSREAIYKILKNKDTIRNFIEHNGPQKFKKITISPFKHLESQLMIWFKQKRSEGIIITCKSFKYQAVIIAKEMGFSRFKGSKGWFERAKNRLNLRSLAVTGQILDCTEDHEIIEWLAKLGTYISENELSPCQVYNSDETGLFFKVRPKRTLVGSSETTAPGRKLDKQRVTVQVCCNATGDNKIRLMVIGRSKKPRCFSGFNVESFVHYKSNKTSWMTKDLLESWFNEEFVPSVRTYSSKMGIEPKALLVMDNAPCHLELVSDDGKIKTMFLPPNSTPLLQPMDIGINKPLKDRYNNSLWKKVTNDGTVDPDLKNLTLDRVIKMITKAWNKIKVSTIINAFGVWFGGTENILNNLPDPPDHFHDEDCLPLRMPPSNMELEMEIDNGKLSFSFSFYPITFFQMCSPTIMWIIRVWKRYVSLHTADIYWNGATEIAVKIFHRALEIILDKCSPLRSFELSSL